MRLPRLGAALAPLALLPSGASASVQDLAPRGAIAPLMHGVPVFHGNDCGPGNTGGHPKPIDALDRACRRHEACVRDFEVPSCACRAPIAREAAAVASDRRAAADLREAAAFTARCAEALPCRRGRGATPPTW